MTVSLEDRFAGCLHGCAVGDALGAPFEGLWASTIPDEAELLRDFAELEGYPRGQFTDDTQLTVATLEAIVEAGGVDVAAIAAAIAALWEHDSVIGPGGACTRAAFNFMKTGDWSTSGAPVGQAGNGTAMRTASLGLLFLEDPAALPEVVANVSRITHQDPRSIAGGVAIAKAAQLLATERELSPRPFCDAISVSMSRWEPAFAELVRGLPAWVAEEPALAVVKLASAGTARLELERPIITPFVVPTVLAALWTLLRFPDDWGRAVASAIRLGGDVDTLGAIVGALMGARLGVRAIPSRLASGVVETDRLRVLAARFQAVAVRRS